MAADGPSAFLDQLARPGRTVDVRPRPAPAVLLLSRACDGGLEPVQGLLGSAGVRSERLNADELGAADLLVDPERRAVRLNGRWLTPTVTWVRHFSASAIESTGDPARTVFLRESWQAAADQLAAVSGTAIRATGPGLLAQLDLARHHRIAVPRTVLTTDPQRARGAFDCPRLVVKAAHHHFVEPEPGRLNGIFPVVVERDDPAADPGPGPGPPVIVQEYVEHEAELRVYHVAGRLHAFRIGKTSPADPWTAPERVGAEPVRTPPAVASATRTLAAAMALRYGAFDFLISAGGPVFLEVNPDGDWLWAEQRAGTAPVTTAVAAMLAALHREALPTPGPFDLLGFLSAPRAGSGG
ncbi:hypothetical protein [Kitasatospora sp. NPDC002965]|uniref:ATP-grasp domain-containing protein n=1 Tax=Kitasatospora sp. NPDC002965 TaxID=3154775 RepID=UPI0033B478BB